MRDPLVALRYDLTDTGGVLENQVLVTFDGLDECQVQSSVQI